MSVLFRIVMPKWFILQCDPSHYSWPILLIHNIQIRSNILTTQASHQSFSFLASPNPNIINIKASIINRNTKITYSKFCNKEHNNIIVSIVIVSLNWIDINFLVCFSYIQESYSKTIENSHIARIWPISWSNEGSIWIFDASCCCVWYV